jgi:hypothetical protein
MRRGSLVVTFVALFGLAIPLLGGARVALPSPAPPPNDQPVAARAHAADPSKAPAPDSPADDGASNGKPAPRCAEDDAVCECERRLVRPLERFFVGASPAPPSPGGRALAEAGHSALFKDVTRRLRARYEGRPLDVEIAIATVPDPVDSGQYYRMDRVVEALRSGVQASSRAPTRKWVPDRFWLPWNDVHADSEASRRSIATCRSLVPGVLLFRDEGLPSTAVTGQPLPLLALLVVGEAPTWGVHKEALVEALDIAEAISPDRTASAPARRTIPLLGPSFSSTAAGLRYALTSWLSSGAGGVRGETCIRITSGAATSVNNQRLLDACGGVDCDECEGRPRITFKATTLPSTALQRALYTYLHDKGGVRAHGRGPHPCALDGVAMLVESGTTYGQSMEERPDPAVAGRRPDEEGACARYEPELVVPFPLHVSTVRHAYETESRAAAEAAVYDKKLALNPSFEEPAPPLDMYPSGSPRTTGSNDLILTAIWGELGRRDVEYVGIIATDRADVIFLAHHARAHYPNARLFTVGTDAYYTHPSVSADVEGMLVASAYPLFGRDQAWRDERQYLAFSGDYDEGTYNATVSTFGRPDRMVDYDEAGGLPTWVAAVGHGGMWALSRTASDDPTGYVLHRAPATTASPPMGARAPRSWRLLLFLLFLFCACNVFAYWVARHREPPSWWHRFAGRRIYESTFRGQIVGFTMLESVAPTSTYFESYSFYRLTTMLVLLVSGGALLGIETLALRLGAPHGERRWVLVFFAVGALVESLLLLCSVDAFASWARGTVRTASGAAPPSVPGRSVAVRRVRTARGVVVVLVAGLAVFLWARALDLGGTLEESALRYDRLTSLGSGVSVVTPVLLVSASFYLWALCHLQRRRLLDGLHTRDGARWRWIYDLLGVQGDAPDSHGDSLLPPAPSAEAARISRASEAVRDADRHENVVARVIRLLGTPQAELMHRVLSVIGLATPAYVFAVVRPIRTMEGHFADVLVWLVFGAWLVMSVSGVFWLLLLWYRFRLLLRRLARHPLVEAYGRLPGAIVSTLERQVTGIVPGTMELAIGVHQLQILTRHAAQIVAATTADPATPTGTASPVTSPPVSAFRSTLARILPDLRRLEAEAERGLASDMRKLGNRDAPLGPYLSEAQPPLGGAAAYVHEALVAFWNALPRAPMKDAIRASGIGPAGRLIDSLPVYTRAVEDDDDLWARLAEELLATQVTLFLYQLMRHFRLFLALITGSAFLFLLALASYSFQPRHLLMSALWIVILSSAGLALTVLVQMGRDELLSRISKTEPGKIDLLDRVFLTRVLALAVFPILSLLAVQYPEVASGVFQGFASLTR